MKSDCNYAGYVGKKDVMRDTARTLLKGDIDRPIKTVPSKSAIQFEKARPYKKGGAVKKSKSELHIPGAMKFKKPKSRPLSQAGDLQVKADKLKNGGKVKMKNPKPIIAGKHPMIGSKAKSPKFASAKKATVNTKRKAKDTNSFDASHGAYL